MMVMVIKAVVVVVVVMMVMPEELREFDPGRLGLGARRLILPKHGDGIWHRLEQVGIARRRRGLRLLRRRGSSTGRHAQGSRSTEKAGKFFVHLIPPKMMLVAPTG